MIDLVEKEKALRAHQSGEARLMRHFKAWPVAIAIFVLAYCTYSLAGLRAAGPDDGIVGGLPLAHAVSIYRDERGIPHIRARDEFSGFFAQGYVQGSDRLFQMDLIRRYAYGELSEMLGPVQLQTDEQMRAYDVHDIVDRQWSGLGVRDRADLSSFAAGVNAAIAREPLPLEFRLLLYRPRAWAPRDSLAVAMAVAISVDDTPDNVLQRDAVWRTMSPGMFAGVLPLSDPAYDVTADGTHRTTPDTTAGNVAWASARGLHFSAAGSNAWAAGGAHETQGHALIANDPHLSLSIPGIWYAIEIRSAGMHVAGVTIPGFPGVVLGHNERIAWATTNAMVSTLSVFDARMAGRKYLKRETFHVRFAPDATKDYYRTASEFAVQTSGDRSMLVRWSPYTDSRSAVSTVFALDRAGNVAGALRILRTYAGPPQNFIVAGTDGHVAYHLAGVVPNDPAWGRYVHPERDLREIYPPIPFDRLPAVLPSRNTIVVSANNKMYGRDYGYRLSPMFAPPYRAYRIAALLHARRFYDAGYFARMQLDTISPADAEFARDIAAYGRTHPALLSSSAVRSLASWNGSFAPGSDGATIEHTLRSAVESAAISPYLPFQAARNGMLPEQVVYALQARVLDPNRLTPWSKTGEVDVLHPFGPIGFPFLNGAPFPGNGDRYTIRVQTPEITQSFRAVWRVGDWDRGGLSLPAGESGEFGSPHYDDLRRQWIGGTLESLPFSDRAVARSARTHLVLKN